MIRTSKQSDTPQIISLWHSSFGDSKAYIRSFLSAIGTPDRCLVAELEGKIASMLFMLPAEIKIEKETRKLFYIYACATSPAFRGKGLMRDLLEASYKQAVEQSAFGLMLIPASKELSAYYQKNGFEPFFFNNNFEWENTQNLQPVALTSEVISQLIAMRKRTLQSTLGVQWPDNHLTFALNEIATEGGKVILEEDFYVLLSAENRVIETLPLERFRQTNDEEYGLIRFCGDEKIDRTDQSYLNFGLD
jgi:GNAT superfamily N-acetyltransferase